MTALMRIFCRTFLLLLLAFLSAGSSAQSEPKEVTLTLGGTEQSFGYISKLLTRVLEREGYQVNIEYVGNLPMTRLERMLAQGGISALTLGETDSRNQRLTPIRVGMTNGLIGRRILFIPRDKQSEYDAIETLADLRASGLVAGMGEAWGDVDIWNLNELPVQTVSGDWKLLYKMVASGTRDIDYLPRGAHEILNEWQDQPDLVVEESLLLVYQRDHILYVSPERPEFAQWLEPILERAQHDGFIQTIVNEFYPEVSQPPINLHRRRIISLESP